MVAQCTRCGKEIEMQQGWFWATEASARIVTHVTSLYAPLEGDNDLRAKKSFKN